MRFFIGDLCITRHFFVRQGRQKLYPEEYIRYFEDSADASLRAKFEA
jgi:hypothetical protein